MKNQKGFTLIELSIVLVIIGIILGAVLKGQDLIVSARAKKVTSSLNAWNVAVFTFMDRRGRFPGDEGSNGIIGDNNNGAGTEAPAVANDTISAIGELESSGFANLPSNPMTLGSYSFYVYLGSSTINGTVKNVMVLCKDSKCATTFSSDELNLVQSVDTAIDGIADGGLGQFRGATAVTINPATPVATAGNRTTSVVTAVTVTQNTSAGVSAPWVTGANFVAAVWLFDRPF